jgi:hypothetical protein
MTARLDVRWLDDDWNRQIADFPLVRQVARPRPELRCPRCDSILYARRHKLCGVCGEELPAALLFSAAEASRVRETLVAERQKHRAWIDRRTARPF